MDSQYQSRNIRVRLKIGSVQQGQAVQAVQAMTVEQAYKRKQPMYVLNVLSLWCARKIDFHTVVHALKNRPIAVAGRGGSYHVDPIDPNE